MPIRNKHYFYWDSCVFIAYLNNSTERISAIKDVWNFVQNHKTYEIITSSMSIAEVVKSKDENETRILNKDIEIQIEKFWYHWGIKTVDMTPVILHEARKMSRKAVTKNIGGLKPADSIHLATALWIEKNLGVLQEIHTYENRWRKNFLPLLNGAKVCEPTKPNPVVG